MQIDLIDKITKLFNENALSKYKLSTLAGINSGTISQILMRKRPLSIDALMKLSLALGLKDDYYFEDYIHYCTLTQGNEQLRSWRSIHPFFNICVERGHVTYIEQLLLNIELNHDKNLWQNVIKVAEAYKNKADKEVLKWLYNYVIKSTSFNRKIISICYYRLYLLSENESLVEQHEQIVYLKSFITDLPEQMYINALLKIATHFYKVENWDEMERYADLLIEITERVYKRTIKLNTLDEFDEKLDRPLVKFYGQGYLLKSSANRNKGNLEVAKKLIQEYSDLTWFPIMDVDGLVEIERFKYFATGNNYHIELMMGNSSIIGEFIEYFEEHKEELLPCIVIILQSANEHMYEVPENVIDHATKLIKEFDTIANHHIYYERGKQESEYIQLTSELSQYYIRNDQVIKGYNIAISCLELSIKIRNDRSVANTIGVLEEFKHLVSSQEIKNYENTLRGLIRNEKKCKKNNVSA